MSKAASTVTPLPESALPTKSSTELIREYVGRLQAQGVPQKVIALSLGFQPNYVSQLKDGIDMLPIPRVLAFAAAARLSDEESMDLLHTRLLELHGQKGEICLETIALWARDICAPFGDEAALIALWRDATMPAPHLLHGLLESPERAARIAAAMNEVVQTELKMLAQEAASG